MEKYYDLEHDIFYTKKELEDSFNELKKNHETDIETFNEYLKECLSKNGTLEKINN